MCLMYCFPCSPLVYLDFFLIQFRCLSKKEKKERKCKSLPTCLSSVGAVRFPWANVVYRWWINFLSIKVFLFTCCSQQLKHNKRQNIFIWEHVIFSYKNIYVKFWRTQAWRGVSYYRNPHFGVSYDIFFIKIIHVSSIFYKTWVFETRVSCLTWVSQNQI